MNKTSIEWCHYPWNPVSGCRHECREQYCHNTQKHVLPTSPCRAWQGEARELRH